MGVAGQSGWRRSLQPKQQTGSCGPQTLLPPGPEFQQIGELDLNSKSIEKPFPPTFQKRTHGLLGGGGGWVGGGGVEPPPPQFRGGCV